jgi:peptide/nickel transport system ATP-binding protein
VLDPALIVADEPTTALDVTVQAEILDLLRRCRDEFNTGILLITHNMGVVADLADRVAVMYRGEIVENASAIDLFADPQHEYTKRLLAAVPRIGGGVVHARERAARRELTVDAPVVVAKDLTIVYPGRFGRGGFTAVNSVDFEIGPREVLGLVGESGSGKTTIGRAIGGLTRVTGGSLRVLGEELLGLVGGTGSGKSTLAKVIALKARQGTTTDSFPAISGGSLTVLGRDERTMSHRVRDRLQLRIGYLAQEGAEQLDQRLTVAENVAEPIYSRDRRFSSREAGMAVAMLIDSVRLPLSVMHRHPHELSSGQRQRVALARALVLEPTLLVADEPTRGVDATVRSGVLDVIRELREEREFSALIVSSDLEVTAELTERVVVLDHGSVVGIGPIDDVLHEPYHPYVQGLARMRAHYAGGLRA